MRIILCSENSEHTSRNYLLFLHRRWEPRAAHTGPHGQRVTLQVIQPRALNYQLLGGEKAWTPWSLLSVIHFLAVMSRPSSRDASWVSWHRSPLLRLSQHPALNSRLPPPASPLLRQHSHPRTHCISSSTSRYPARLGNETLQRKTFSRQLKVTHPLSFMF